MNSTCFNDADCPAGQTCVVESAGGGGACRPACASDADCADGYYCDLTHGACRLPACVTHDDCKGGDYCDPVTRTCRTPDCWEDSDCDEGFECVDWTCRATGELLCPDGMVPVNRTFCIDVYEASRPDATADNAGVDGSMAVTKKGVMPWRVVDNAEADAACRNAEKSLCTADEWQAACVGPEEAPTAYGYGDEYDPTTCNGIDTYCYCEDEGCSSDGVCPFPYCYQTCGASFHLTPTGAFPDCTNDFGVFDMNGNLWEHVLGGDDTLIRGGAFNCGDSLTYHRCDYIPITWTPSARGFRCCAPGHVVGEVDTDGETAGGDTE